jgi:hypothetical protein
MTPKQQVRVQTSFAKVAPIADTVAMLLYDDLFQRNPRLRVLFKDDMAKQGGRGGWSRRAAMRLRPRLVHCDDAQHGSQRPPRIATLPGPRTTIVPPH